ncbi:hypothetical protein JHK85_044842 [Glycine max]|uniref:Uncharacterized protein n=1 Tax=Glycine soja TaxID=3848 RepID=A0A0B2QB59_GLYSO|nr:hypothetical protein JHK85_044842 [Glycine max]KHN18826.1 hypothetical protein glysoja_045346 [Glycine soja]
MVLTKRSRGQFPLKVTFCIVSDFQCITNNNSVTSNTLADTIQPHNQKTETPHHQPSREKIYTYKELKYNYSSVFTAVLSSKTEVLLG